MGHVQMREQPSLQEEPWVECVKSSRARGQIPDRVKCLFPESSTSYEDKYLTVLSVYFLSRAPPTRTK